MDRRDDSNQTSVEGARCPSCGIVAADHDPSPCLDRWVLERFFEKQLTGDEVAPPYSSSPRQRCLDDLIDARRWPQGLAVMQTSLGCTVGRRVPRGDRPDGYEYYDVIATGGTLPLAVCRAALSLSSPGTAPLRVK